VTRGLSFSSHIGWPTKETLTITRNQNPIKVKEKDVSVPSSVVTFSISDKANLENPYPTEDQKEKLAMNAGLTVEQIKRCLGNKRSDTNKQIPYYFMQNHP
jgi:hypothetical protein